MKELEKSGITAALVLVAVVAGGFILYQQFFAKKLAPVGGVKGAAQLASGVDQIASGFQSLTQPVQALFRNFSDLFSGNGAGSSPTPPADTPPMVRSDAENYVPPWANAMQSAVNTVGSIPQLVRDIQMWGK